MSSPRVLLSAYQCAPGMGSVSQIGWEWYSRMAVQASVTLVTHVRNRSALEEAGVPLTGSEIIYVDTEWFARPLYRMASAMFPNSQHSVFLLSSLDFFVYDRYALKHLQRRFARGERWDIVHAVTPVSPVAPTLLHRLGIPVILGPLNGGIPNPPNFPEIMREDSGWLYPLRNAGRIADALIGSSRSAHTILTATEATRQSVPAKYRNKCRQMLENGVDPGIFRPSPWPPVPANCGVLRIMFVGRLIPVKALSLLLRAMRAVQNEFPVFLTVVGDGPMRKSWEAEAESLGLGQMVVFTGSLPLSKIAQHLASAHVFCLPSVRESGGAVVLEAMAVGRPVIVVAYGGPAEIVDDGVGCAVTPDGPQAVSEQIAAALRDVIAKPEAWRQRGVEGTRRVDQSYSWDSKIRQGLQLYQTIAKGRRAA